jgi:hypothetical protein
MLAASLCVVSACTVTPPASDLDRFEATLAAHESATKALEAWCRSEGLASDQPIRAVVARGAQRRLPAEAQRLAGDGAGSLTGYRHVRLTCGQTVLSEAHNWYAAGRLSEDMRRALETGDIPFGRAAAPLGFRRRLLSSTRGAPGDCPPATVLTQQAMLVLPDGAPLALLVECYSAAVLPRS